MKDVEEPILGNVQAKRALEDMKVMQVELTKEQQKELRELFERTQVVSYAKDCESKIEIIPQMYQMIGAEEELHWFFDHVIQRPQVNESYSAVFVSRHKKLTKEEQEEFGLTRKEAEFLATQTFRLRNIKEESMAESNEIWNFNQFLARVKRFNVDKGAYTTGKGLPLPEKTLAIIFYVNPGDDMKVCKRFVEEYNEVNEAITKAMLIGKTTKDNYQSYQWFGNAESNIKHLKANCKGNRYWMDFDIDVPKWFKTHTYKNVANEDRTYYEWMKSVFETYFGKGNYVIVDTGGGYHVLVRTGAIKQDPHKICKEIESIYTIGVSALGEESYLDEKGNCKFECIINDSQIPGLPLPGTYQYGRVVRVVNKEDFE